MAFQEQELKTKQHGLLLVRPRWNGSNAVTAHFYCATLVRPNDSHKT